MKKRTLLFSVLGIVLLIAILMVGKKQGWLGTDYRIRVAVEEVTKRTITELVSANGKIQPEIEVSITPYISGEVVQLGVKEGDKVSKGDFLAKIDPEIYISNYERAEANLNTQKANMANAKARLVQAKAQFTKAENEFKRNKKLFDEQVISEAEFESVTSSYEVAKAEVSAAHQSLKAAEFNVKSSEASLKEAKENLTRTSIYAPVGGTVSQLNVETGERVTGASQFSAGTEIMRIADLDKMEVNVEVNENDIIRIALFDTALIEVDAYYKRKFKGVITEIATSANTTQTASTDQVTNFDVKVRILADSYQDLITPDSKLNSPFRPGMSANVDIQTNTAYQVLAVPIQSVVAKTDTTSQQTDPEIKEYVFVEDGGIAFRREVVSGIQDTRYIQIKEGLKPDERVVVAPYRAITNKLADSTFVEVVDKKQLFEE
jgi:HlyD family secretion protein